MNLKLIFFIILDEYYVTAGYDIKEKSRDHFLKDKELLSDMVIATNDYLLMAHKIDLPLVNRGDIHYLKFIVHNKVFNLKFVLSSKIVLCTSLLYRKNGFLEISSEPRQNKTFASLILILKTY